MNAPASELSKAEHFAEPAFDLAAMLRLARDAVVSMEDESGRDRHEVNTLHAVQRTLGMCIREAERMGSAALQAVTVGGGAAA